MQTQTLTTQTKLKSENLSQPPIWKPTTTIDLKTHHQHWFENPS